MRRAEVKLYDALKEQLPAGWVVFYSIAWLTPTARGAPRDGETDFIAAHPGKGVLLIEVKGGGISYDERRRQWISRDRFGIDHDIDPFEQVKKNKYALLEKLKGLSSLKDRWIDLSHAVAFPDRERPRHAITPDAPPQIIIGRDDLHRLPQRIEEVLSFVEAGGARRFEHGPLIVQELKRVLGQTTELRNPLSLEAAEEDREIVRLTEEQFRLLDHLSRVPRAAIGGCAGSGKTFLAVEKARRLAGEEFRTLLTCFNQPLAEFLAQLARDVPNLEVKTFHDLCEGMILAAGMDVPRDLDEYPTALFDAMALVPELRYDAIVVDEGQDFMDTWWVALESCLQSAKESAFYVFHDTHQTLYRGTGSLPSDLVPIPLTENIRNTRSVFDVLARHYRGETRIQPRGPVGRTVETHSYKSPAELKNELSRVLHRLLLVESFRPEDLVVLTPRALDRSELPGLALPTPLKLSTEPRARTKDVLLSTVHSFKGLERRVAIVAELDETLPRDAAERDRLCYVAFSRPRSHLILLGTPDVLPNFVPAAA